MSISISCDIMLRVMLRNRSKSCVSVSFEQEHLDQELRNVLEENVSLQKQLIRLEQQLLSDKLREMPNAQRRGDFRNQV